MNVRQHIEPGDKVVAIIKKRSLLIAIPFYKEAHLVKSMMDALNSIRSDLAQINAHVLFFNDSPDDKNLNYAFRQYEALRPSRQTDRK